MDFLKTLSNILLLAGAGLVFVLIWGATVLAVLTSTQRRALPRADRLFWVALALILPVVGALIYLLAGPVTRWIASDRREVAYPRVATETQLPGPAEAPAATAAPAPVASYLVSLPAQLRLRAIAGPAAGRSYSLEQLPARIGRGAEAQISLTEDARVSRRHAELYREGEALRLRDLGSLHGTLLNDRPILDEALRPGDQFRVGDTMMVIEYG